MRPGFVTKIAFLLLALLVGLVLVPALVLAYTVTRPLNHPICCQTPADFGADYESIRFQTVDGLWLAGWYIPPSQGKAVIILLHTYYADRRQVLPVARMLSAQGYGILMYDQRASGESQGDSRSLGWRDIPDLGAATEWLASRAASPAIGVYGCSMGASIALAGAANLPVIRAAVLDAPSPLGYRENLPQFNPRDPLMLPIMGLYYPIVMLRARVLPPSTTLQAVKQFGQRPLLFISSGSGNEKMRVETYFAAAPGPRSHWNLPTASHCSGPQQAPLEYSQHLLDFFNTNLP